LLVGLVYPLLEEWLFRGFLQGWLREHPTMRRSRLGISWANLLTSLLFVLFHLLRHPPVAALAVLAPSLIFGHLRDRQGSLLGPILLHAFYNIGYFWLLSG